MAEHTNSLDMTVPNCSRECRKYTPSLLLYRFALLPPQVLFCCQAEIGCVARMRPESSNHRRGKGEASQLHLTTL